jgi:hypothetical protein
MNPLICHPIEETYFRNIPKNMRNFEVSSGSFSMAAVGLTDDDSEAVEGAVEAGEASKDPEDVEAMSGCYTAKQIGTN